MVLVRKKDGEVRLYANYRKVNGATQKDAHPLPKIEECLDTLSASKLFSTLDLLDGYHQFEVNEKDRPKTAFIMGCYSTRQCLSGCAMRLPHFKGAWRFVGLLFQST